MGDGASELGQSGFTAAISLGEKVRLCGDKDFVAVVVSVQFDLGKRARYCLKWRDCRGFVETWMTAAEIEAVGRLVE